METILFINLVLFIDSFILCDAMHRKYYEWNQWYYYPDLTTYQIHRDLLIVSIRSFCCLKYKMKLKRWKVSFYSCRVYFKWQKTCNIVSYYTPCSFVIFLVIPKIFGEPFYPWIMVCQNLFDKQDFLKNAIIHKRRYLKLVEFAYFK